MADTMSRPIADIDDLKERVQRYLDTSSRGIEAKELAERLREVGDVAIFGGMLRDFARGYEQSFNSDIDLVVDATPERLESFLMDYKVQRNRFGGYRLHGRDTQFDVWTLHNTWAIREGHVQACGLNDLINTTFFDCDAIVYVVHSKEIYCHSNFVENINKRTVDILLKDNPNLLGAVARTLRALVEWRAELGPELTKFLAKSLDDHCLYEIEKAQVRTYGRVAVDKDELTSLKIKLRDNDIDLGKFKLNYMDIVNDDLF